MTMRCSQVDSNAMMYSLTHTHVYSHTHMTYSHTHIQMYTHMYHHTHTYMYTHMYSHTYIQMYSHMYSRTHMYSASGLVLWILTELVNVVSLPRLACTINICLAHC